MWAIVEIVTTCLNLMVFACVLNQIKGHWLLSNALVTVIQLDSCYKSLQVVEIYVGRGNVICLASKYDMKKVIPLLMITFERLNPSIQTQVVVSIDGLLVEEDETNMFGVGASME